MHASFFGNKGAILRIHFDIVLLLDALNGEIWNITEKRSRFVSIEPKKGSGEEKKRVGLHKRALLYRDGAEARTRGNIFFPSQTLSLSFSLFCSLSRGRKNLWTNILHAKCEILEMGPVMKWARGREREPETQSTGNKSISFFSWHNTNPIPQCRGKKELSSLWFLQYLIHCEQVRWCLHFISFSADFIHTMQWANENS